MRTLSWYAVIDGMFCLHLSYERDDGESLFIDYGPSACFMIVVL